MNLKTRLEKLEARVAPPDEQIVILREFVDAVEGKSAPMPVVGWEFKAGNEQVVVMRKLGESDEELKARASELAWMQSPDKPSIRMMAVVNEQHILER